MRQSPEQQAEHRYLNQVLTVAKKQWELARKSILSREEAISSAYEDMRESAPDDLGDLHSKEGFYNLAALSQYVLPVTGEVAAYGTGMQAVRTLEGMMDSPYFARIDFRFEQEESPEKIYIGRATLMEKASMSVFVHDWRAPIASVFYRFGLGPASFTAPGGLTTGEVLLKRQYEIRNGHLQYYFDADVQVIDEFLRQLLARQASAKMKTIVETIQRDQDIVIRDMQSDVLMVQGAAGSGKTSIALHRIAYLMYQGLAGKLNASDILILSPNAVFEEYISHVLPDLGESNVQTMLFEDLFQKLLPKERFHPRTWCLEQLLSCREAREAELMQAGIRFQGSFAFVQMLDRLVTELPGRWIPFQDIDYAGRNIAKRGLLKTAVCNTKKIAPLGIQLMWLEQEIFEKVHALYPGRMEKLIQFAASFPEHSTEVETYARCLSIRESAVLLGEIRTFTSIDCKAVYKRLFCDKEAFYRLGKGLDLPENIEEIRRHTAARLAEGPLWHGDAAALCYLYIRLYGCGAYRHIRQVVLDEAQDEDPMHFAILRELFANARFTVLGDVFQTIGKQEDVSLYERIGKMLHREKVTLASMEKSFRCTMEIWQFSTGFLPPGAAGQCFSRSGDTPAIHGAENAAQMDELLIQEVEACKERGHQSIGLICKTEQDARALYARLESRLKLKLIHSGAMGEIGGTLVLPIYLAKGLEFDAVLVCNADSTRYHTEEDKRLLYIACTRALHRLNVFYTGEASPLLNR